MLQSEPDSIPSRWDRGLTFRPIPSDELGNAARFVEECVRQFRAGAEAATIGDQEYDRAHVERVRRSLFDDSRDALVA